MSTSEAFSIRGRVARPMRLVWCVALVALSMFAVTAIAGAPKAGALSIGNSACGKLIVTPGGKVVGGTAMTIKVHWLGGPSTAKCRTSTADCPTFWGSCNAGYWIAGVFCSTLAAKDLATAQGDCDLNNVIVMTDYNSGPNSPGDKHGTSWNQCSTVNTLGSIFGGLPGTLYCVTDGSGGDNWSDHFPLGARWGTVTGPAEQTGSSVPFRPATSGVDCPPSAANIAAGAIPNMCAFVVMPLNFSYYCTFDACVPDVSLPNSGVTENTKDYLAGTFTYGKG